MPTGLGDRDGDTSGAHYSARHTSPLSELQAWGATGLLGGPSLGVQRVNFSMSMSSLLHGILRLKKACAIFLKFGYSHLIGRPLLFLAMQLWSQSYHK